MSFLKILKGIDAPKDSRAYKEARIELQRLASPATALLLPLLVVAALAAATGREPEQTVVEIEARELEVESPPELEKVDPPEPPPPSEETVELDFPIDAPSGAASAPAAETVPAEGPAVEPAVAPVASPVMLKGIKMRNLPGGRGKGVGSAFGYGSGAKGDLVGTLYDLKRDRKGHPRALDYWQDVRSIIASKCTPSAFAPYYAVEKKVYLPYLYIPNQSASAAPKAFGVDGLMEPCGWIAHYAGTFRPRTRQTVRFVGHFDDCLYVLLDGKVVLDFGWDYANPWRGPSPVTGWKPTDLVDRHGGIIAPKLVYGDWVELDPRRPARIDILCGERPGGAVGGLLLLQDQSQTYPTTPEGRPILPLFCVSALTPDQIEMMEQSTFKLDPLPPIMTIGPRPPAPAVDPDDITVDSGDL